MAGKRKDVYLVVGGKYHDFDFARLELLKLLAHTKLMSPTILRFLHHQISFFQ